MLVLHNKQVKVHKDRQSNVGTTKQMPSAGTEPSVAKGVLTLRQKLQEGAKGLIPLCGLIAYTVIGALLFSELEYPNEVYTYEMAKHERERALEETVYKLNTRGALKPIQAYNVTKRILLKYQEQLGVQDVDLDGQMKWGFWGSVFYCMTIYTTIGYGNIAPATTRGQIMTVFYAFLGIPLALIVLYSLGLLFAKFCRSLWRFLVRSTTFFNKKMAKKVNEAVGMEEGEGNKTKTDDDDLLSFPITFLIFVTVLWIFFCAAVFMLFEDWSYGTSLYFTLISFTTIGFGDIVPSEYKNVVIVGFLLLIGLSLVSTVLTLIQQQIQALAMGMQENIDREYMNALESAADDGEISDDMLKKLSDDPLDEEKPEAEKQTLDAVIGRMPLKERVLFYVMPKTAKKALQKNAEAKANRKTRGCQTDWKLLERLIQEEAQRLVASKSKGTSGSHGTTTDVSPRLPPTLEPPRTLDLTPTSSSPEPPSPFSTTPPGNDRPAFVMPTTTTRLQEEEEEETDPIAPPRQTRGFKIEKVLPVESQPTEAVITTTLIKEDDV